MELNSKQKEAVEYLSGPLLVLAGPGTGKTQLLSQKVAYILKNTDTNPENILCLTFTDTGAENMRERLKSIIGPKAAAKVNIGTYHAFGSNILSQYRNYNENYDRKLDSSLDEVTQFKIIKKLQEALPGNDILRGDSVKDIADTISDAKSAQLSAHDLQKIAEQNMEDSAELSAIISPFLMAPARGKYENILANIYQPIAKILSKYLDAAPILPGVYRWPTALAISLKEAIEESNEKPSTTPLTKWRNDNFEKDEKGMYRLKDRIANKKLLSLANLMESYEEYLAENALFDYDDMIEEAVKALKTDDGFRMTLEERYQYILLDEFQDTNPSQFAIVKALTSYENPMVMAVGDDDQAIYEFQGALSSNLNDFREYYNAYVVPLVENYRSTQEILDFAEKVIAQVPDKKFGTKKLIAHREAPKTSQIFRYEFGASDAEYGFVADKISELVKNGVNQNEIAIITRKNKYFEPLLPYLKEHDNIRISYEKRDNLFEDEKIHQVLAIAKYAWEMANEKKPTVQIIEIMSYPFFGASLMEVVKLCSAAKKEHRTTTEYLYEHGSDAVKNVLDFLETIAGLSFTAPLDVIMFNIIEKMGPDRMEAYERFRFYENLASLTGKLNKHFGDKKKRLGDLIEMINDYEEAEMPLNTTSPYKDADEAVRLMSVHAAKGLEFKYVFVISVDDKAWGKAKGNNNFLSLPKNLIQIRHTGITDGERLRVMYVALTRAKETLILTNSVRDFNGATPNRLEYFDEYAEKNASGKEEIVSPLIPRGYVEQMEWLGTLAEREKNVRNWLAKSFSGNPDIKLILKEQMKGYRISATALSKFVNIIYGGPKEFYNIYVLNTQKGPDTWQLAFGILIHKVFERVTKNGISDDDAIAFYLEEVEKYDATDEIKKILREKGPTSLAASLERFRDIIRNGQAEVNFDFENIVVDGIPVNGKIDHMVVDEKNKTIEIYDFKTGAFHPEKWTAKPSLFENMLQLEFYKMLLNNSRKYRGYKVAKGNILFVTQDDDGEVYKKTYEFDDKIKFTTRNTVDYEFNFIDLLKAVYYQATTLDFVDDPELFLDADSNRNMKSVRDFIRLLLEKNKIL